MKKKWGIEYSFIKDGVYSNEWENWKKYKSQRRMLQALRNLKQNNIGGHIVIAGKGVGKRIYRYVFIFRPVHVYYQPK